MPEFDLVLRGGSVVLPDRVSVADIVVSEGKIAGILAPGTPVSAGRQHDVGGLTIMPGAIDPHLHLGHGNDIARPRVPADADQETAAAAAGGITCFIPYMMSSEPFSDVFDTTVATTEAGARIDFGYHLIVSTEEQLAEVPTFIRDRGVPSLKIFMNNRGGEGERLNLPDIDDGFLFRLCEAAARFNGMVCPHPETIEIAWILRNRLRASDPTGRGGLAAWNASRPPFVEAEAIHRAGFIARVTGSRVYFVHTSSEEALKAAVRMREAGSCAAIETCPHYLTHDAGWAGGAIGKVNPPLRNPEDREALWRAVADGTVDTIGTDHVHRGIEGKNKGIWDASPGLPGLETMLPVMITEGFRRRGIPLPRISALTAGNAARLMGLGHCKGSIAIGLDADFAIVDLEGSRVVERENVVSGAGYSIYEGTKLFGRVVHTLVRGRFVFQDGQPIGGAAGFGRFIPRFLDAQSG